MRKALITGSEGFVGKYLKEQLELNGWKVMGLNLRDGYDLRNYETVRNAIDIARPDAIFHLAAQASPAESFGDPHRAIDVNIHGSLNILNAVKNLGVKTRIHLAGTSEEYGSQKNNEDDALEPRSPYAITKVAMDYFGQLYTKAYGLQVVVTRAFNHTGAGRGEMYAEASFAKQIAEIEAGKRDAVEHGNLDSIRNYTDVRDIVRAYEMAVDLPSGVYNICSDQNLHMYEVLDKLKALSTEKDIKDITVSGLVRPADFDFKKPQCNKFKKLTGWKPEFTIDDTLTDILNEWRAKNARP